MISLAVILQLLSVFTVSEPVPKPEAPEEFTEEIKSNFHEYSINVGGTLDGFNTVYYAETYGNFMREESKFEPNQYLVMKNTGKTDIVNPRIVINDRRDWFSADTILNSIFTPDMTEAEKAMAVFKFTADIKVQCHENNRRVGPPFTDDTSNPSRNTFSERANPVKAVNHYYCSGCSLSAANFVVLCRHAGLMARAVWMCPLDVYETHCVGEVWYDNSWHLFDPERRSFYLREDKTTVASYEDLHNNPSLAEITHDGGFASKGMKSHGPDYQKFYPPHTMPVEQWLSDMGMILRPGEKFIWLWDHSGKFRCGDNHRNKNYQPYRLANGKMIYKPDLGDPVSRNGVLSELNISMSYEDEKEPAVHSIKSDALSYVIYKVETPYPIVGGIIGGKFYRKTQNDSIKVYLSVDNSDWIQVWSAEKTGNLEEYFSIDDIIDPKTNPARYSYYVKYEFLSSESSINAGINQVYIETDLQMSALALPSLSIGQNNVVYRDDTKAPHKIKITHGWKESSENTPPLPPEKPIIPADGEILDSEKVIWQASQHPDSKAIAEYHIQVSPRKDMLHPVSPNFDMITFSDKPEWLIPQDWFIAGKEYYWRVRARDEWGAWSDWSNIWTFKAQ
ncbi:hypothetical protein GF312_22290 [Candidatus Poribacteria bacterium]|nr:hypothetical protein [Candidatus Poribacteria bacterium]